MADTSAHLPAAAVDDPATKRFCQDISSALKPDLRVATVYSTPCPWLGRAEMDRVPTSTLELPSTLVYRTVGQRCRPCSPCSVITNGEPRLKAPPDQGNRLQNITALRMVLVPVSASAGLLSRELAASPEDIRAATASIEAPAFQADLAARASAPETISPTRDPAAGGSFTPETHEVGALVWCVHAGLSTHTTWQALTSNVGMSNDISVPIAIAAIVSTAVGTCLISLLLYYLVIRHRKAKQRAHEEEKEVNAALDRAIVSYIVKGLPSPQGSDAPAHPPAPVTDEPPRLELEMTAALGATMDSLMGEDVPGTSRRSYHEPPSSTTPHHSHHGSPTSISPHRSNCESPILPTPMGRRLTFDDQQQQFAGRMGLPERNKLMPLRKTVSSRPVDSAESVYASILARPLEHVRARSEPPMVTPVPAPRDDVGWPLTSKDGWL